MNHAERTTRTTTDVSVPWARRGVRSFERRTIRALEGVDEHEGCVASSWHRWLGAVGGRVVGRCFGGRGDRESHAPTGPHDEDVAVRELVDLGEGHRGQRLRAAGPLDLARR